MFSDFIDSTDTVFGGTGPKVLERYMLELDN